MRTLSPYLSFPVLPTLCDLTLELCVLQGSRESGTDCLLLCSHQSCRHVLDTSARHARCWDTSCGDRDEQGPLSSSWREIREHVIMLCSARRSDERRRQCCLCPDMVTSPVFICQIFPIQPLLSDESLLPGYSSLSTKPSSGISSLCPGMKG